MRWGFYLAACAATALAATAYAANVQISLATNASFAIYSGAADGTNLALQSTGNLPASAGTPTPGKFSFEMEDDSYLYIVAWGDPRLARGLLAEFVFNGLVVLGGDPAWEVCPATLDVTDGPPSPSAVAATLLQTSDQ